MTGEWLVLIESNTTGSGRLFGVRARELGLRPVLFSRNPDRYPYVRTDGLDSRLVDTANVDELRHSCAALPGRVAGVVSSSEYFIATASELASDLGLPHADASAVQACRDKICQRTRLHEAGVPGPAFAAATTADEAVSAAGRIAVPVVVKPVAGSGSIGVRRCDTLDEVRAAAGHILTTDPAELALPPQRAVVVEHYVAGPEYSVETLDDRVIGVTGKHLGPRPYFVEVGHDFPAPVPPGDEKRLAEVTLAALRALGLGWGAAHVELRCDESGPSIIEVNPRLAGGMIPRMVHEACGVDMIAELVAKAAGHRRVATTDQGAGAAAIRFLVAQRSGRLVAVDGLAQARAVPGVVEVELTCQLGQELVIRHSFQDRLAYVIAAGAQCHLAAQAAEAGVDALRVRMSQ
jgi:S-sulfo-L-cysteine synthase (3-phospho-L-serine-dependent)